MLSTGNRCVFVCAVVSCCLCCCCILWLCDHVCFMRMKLSMDLSIIAVASCEVIFSVVSLWSRDATIYRHIVIH